MSKRSEAKKARRRKRQAARGPRWSATDHDLELLDRELELHGWVFDVDHSTDEMVTWYYPPSGIDTDDESVETVTRLWLTEDEQWHLILAGSGEGDVDYVFDDEALLEHLEAIETYRAGGPAFAVQE